MKSQKIGFLQLEMLEIVGIAMIVGSEKYIAKSNIERVLFVLYNPVIFLSNEHSHISVEMVSMNESHIPYVKKGIVLSVSSRCLTHNKVPSSASGANRLG